jgi:hypothetical protein
MSPLNDGGEEQDDEIVFFFLKGANMPSSFRVSMISRTTRRSSMLITNLSREVKIKLSNLVAIIREIRALGISEVNKKL